MGHGDFGVVDETIDEGFVLVSAVHVADLGTVLGGRQVGAEELEGRVEVEQCHFGDHAFVEDEVDHVVVVIDAFLIDRGAWKSERQDSGPRNAEREVLDAHRSDSLDILLIVVVMLVGDIALGSTVLNQNVHQRGRLALFGRSSLDLTSTRGHAKFETRREVVAVGRAKVVLGRQNQLRGRDWGCQDRSTVQRASRILSEVGRIGVLPKSRPRRVSVRVV